MQPRIELTAQDKTEHFICSPFNSKLTNTTLALGFCFNNCQSLGKNDELPLLQLLVMYFNKQHTARQQILIAHLFALAIYALVTRRNDLEVVCVTGAL